MSFVGRKTKPKIICSLLFLSPSRYGASGSDFRTEDNTRLVAYASSATITIVAATRQDITSNGVLSNDLQRMEEKEESTL